ncbi:Wall-associated receptor kinase 1 [Dichanthelium oligosanthes]|uniref:Wall-associated receptor kinase 1 n=1 Tax=Dichanthelium oligosanthes TaxID=888268 RepID=A0A1E5UW39_9POAL|nr:Wall-associated receptor kinase 1 [Dichanthelium oligosanthes]
MDTMRLNLLSFTEDEIEDNKSFTEDQIEKITNNYSTPIGRGGFGEVYKGDLNGDYDLVAVKRYIRDDLREEFMKEVNIHSQMKHKNVVKLIGSCISETNLTLVTEYISRGNLEDILHNSDIPISLDTRLGIAIGCAEALSYMHSMQGDGLICHGDIKPANILLDDNFTAKVSDFGLSRLLLGGISRNTRKVIGSIDYMDPVLLREGRLTPRNDVYSFGIVLLELIARKRVKEADGCLVGTFTRAKGQGLQELFDSEIANTDNNIYILQQMVKLANECLDMDLSKRPKMNDVEKRLRELKSNVVDNIHENRHQSIWFTHCSWHKIVKQDKVQFRKSPSFLRRNASNSIILLGLGNVRSFTKEDLNKITGNYSNILGGGTPAKFYKGILEDNTAAVVRKFHYADYTEAFMNGRVILSQIVHKNIIKLLGYCCLESETLMLIYEYANKEALQYLHSSANGIIGHGSVAASTILLDSCFLPKLTDFSRAFKLIKEGKITDSSISRDLLEEVLYNDPSRYMSVLMNLESDVYMFGGVLFAIISREKTISLDDLVIQFTKAYQTDNSGKEFFDKDITAEEDIAVLEAIGRLALKCTILDVDEMLFRPTMKEAAEELHMVRKSWKERTTVVRATQLSSMGTTSPDIKIFTEDEIKNITSNFSTLIGRGGFGEVYRGVLDADYDLVAVKRYIREGLREEFMEEVNIHSMMSHKNVVKLIGYCVGESTLMLVTEYISNGNLDDILHKSDTPIPLDIRLGIAIGCAEALSYMHSMHLSSDNLIYHGDIKPANILLDDNLTTKVSDFGLSRLLFGGDTEFTTSLKGSMGYMDPIYFHEGRLTLKSDVYSFGIVLLELITRKRVKHGDSNLIRTINKAIAKGKGLRELFDATIIDDRNIKILKEMGKLAAECVTLEIRTRPEMSDVAKRLRTLKKDLKGSPQSILAAHSSWQMNTYKQNTSMPSFKKGFSFFKGNASNSKIISELGNVRIFTKEEINEVTQNYSYPLSTGTSTEVYKGTLEDNTQVVVNKFLQEDSKEVLINGGMTLSQIVHKNIIKLLGCCLEDKTLIFIYEYIPKGSLFDILASQEDLPLDLRMRIAIKTAEALEYLHSSATGIIGHGGVATPTILLDDNFIPKLTDFSRACKLIKKSEATAGGSVISSSVLEKVLDNDPSCYGSVLINLERDVYRFGGVLMALICRDKNTDNDDLIIKFTKAYETDKSGKAMFDNDITSEEDIALLEEIGRLALQCTILKGDEMFKRPTMKEVAAQLCMLRRSWKERTTETDTLVIETDTRPVMSAEPRIPNLMRHLFGYRRISTRDPINTR